MIKLKVNSLAGLRIIEVNLILAQSDCSNTALLILLASIINFWHHPLVIVGELELRIIVNLYAPSIGTSLSLNSKYICLSRLRGRSITNIFVEHSRTRAISLLNIEVLLRVKHHAIFYEFIINFRGGLTSLVVY